MSTSADHDDYLRWLGATQYDPPRNYRPRGRHAHPVAVYDPDSSSFDDLPMSTDGELHEPREEPKHRK